jgi:UDP-glucose-4-epimerase GalE
MRILVTGGAGYVGSVTVHALLAAGHDVVVLDTLERGDASRVGAARLVVGSVTDERLVGELLRAARVDAVLHFAAYRSVEESTGDPLRYHANNVGGSLALFRAMAAAGVRDLVHSSTCAVYGTPAELPVNESAELRPMNPYATGKRIVEDVLADLATAGTIRPVVLRYFNAGGAVPDAGLGETTDGDSLLARVLRSATGREVLRVFGTDYPTRDGTAVRDFVHVSDLAGAHLLALDHLGRGAAPVTLNLGSGTGSTVLEVIRAVERTAGRPVPWSAAPRRAGDPVESRADIRRAADVLGWVPTRSLEVIADSAWRFHAGAR